MNVFHLRNCVVTDYANYIKSFINIADPEISKTVHSALTDGKLWPDPLLQFNPTYEQVGSVESIAQAGMLHSAMTNIYKGYSIYRHQLEAIRLGVQGKDFVVTSGTGSGKSLMYIASIFHRLFSEPQNEGVAPESIVDSTVRARFLGERAVMILEKNSYVFFGVSPTMIDNMKAVGLISPNDLQIISEYWFVEGKLETPLMLQVRGDQEARLSPCSCTIPSLNTTADSLNHAFTLISVAFETKRRSHSGNVFERVHTQAAAGKWQPLDEIRIAAIAKLQADATNNRRQ